VLPQYFNVDGRTGYRKPVDVMAEVLEASVYLITASSQEHDCLVNALHSASLGVDETIAESTAAAYGSLLDGDRKEGAALIDIGAHSSDLAVYHGDALLCAASLPIGGEHFTNDLCYGFKVAPEDAELLKLQYGCALVGMTSSSSLVEVPSPEGRPAREARRMDLNNVLQIRGEELFERAAAEIARAGLDRQLLGGVLLAGGAAKLPGLLDLAEKVLGCQARLALPIGIADLPETLDDPAWTTCAGLAMYGARLKLRQETQKRAPGLLGLMFR
jgi:cell division protein FtsA